MGYQLESNPALIGSDYWGGCDIDNPEVRAAYPYADVTLRKPMRRAAAIVLAECLYGVYDDRIDEQPYLPDEQGFNPDPASLITGSVVILNTEFLARWDDEAQTEEIAANLEMPEQKWQPIEGPFTALWRRNQLEAGSDKEAYFGEEYAFYPEEKSLYGHYLAWGVLLNKKQRLGSMKQLDGNGSDNGERFLQTWNFREPWLGEDDLVHLSPGTNRKYRLLAVPLPISEVLPSYQEGPDISYRMIQRVMDVSVVYNGLYGNNNRKTHERPTALRSRAHSFNLWPTAIPNTT